jgi:hypothetical protein
VPIFDHGSLYKTRKQKVQNISNKNKCTKPNMLFLICDRLYVLLSFQKISVMVSVLTLTAISIERWMAICRPLMFRQTWVRAKRAIAIVWIISLAAGVPDAVSLDLLPVSPHPEETKAFCGPSWSQDTETVHLWINFVVFYLVPLAIMTLTYFKVALCLWQSGMVDENDGKFICFNLSTFFVYRF